MTFMTDREMEWASATRIWLLVILMLLLMVDYLYSLRGASESLALVFQ